MFLDISVSPNKNPSNIKFLLECIMSVFPTRNNVRWKVLFISSHPNFQQKRFKILLAHLAQRGHVSYYHHLASVAVVRRKLFQRSSPLKLLDQLEPNLVWIITRVSSFKIVSSDAVHQSTWPLLLKIEHMVKLQVFG